MLKPLHCHLVHLCAKFENGRIRKSGSKLAYTRLHHQKLTLEEIFNACKDSVKYNEIKFSVGY